MGTCHTRILTRQEQEPMRRTLESPSNTSCCPVCSCLPPWPWANRQLPTRPPFLFCYLENVPYRNDAVYEAWNWVSSQAQVSGVWFNRSLLLLDCGSVPRVGVCVNPSFHFSGISACEYSCWVIWDLYAVWETATRFPKGAMPCYIPTSSVGSSEVHIPASLWCSQGFPEQFCWVWSHLFTCICLKARDVEHLTWLLVILVGMRWYLTVALIFIFPWWLMVSFHVLMAYLHVIFSGITVQTLSSF